MLRQVDDNKKAELYVGIRDVLTIILPFAFVAYIPIGYLIGMWLPQYESSIVFLGILLPICTYNGKMNLLCNTYYKVLRKEKSLLHVNILTMLLSLLLSAVSVFVFNSIVLVAISIVVAIAFRSYVSELYIAKIMGHNILKDILIESVMVICFMLVSWYTKGINAFILILICYVIFLVLNKTKLNVLKKIKLFKA